MYAYRGRRPRRPVNDNYRYPSTSLQDASGYLWILPRPKKVSTGHFFTPPAVGPASSNPYSAPKRNAARRRHFPLLLLVYTLDIVLFYSSATNNSPMPTPLPGAFIGLWILPRPKKQSTGLFLTLPSVGSVFRIPTLRQKK